MGKVRFAKLDENNIVIGTVMLLDTLATTEAKGIENLRKMYGWEFWKRTYYGTEEGPTNPRKNFAKIGFIYDEVADAFKPVSPPHASWVRNATTLLFEPPNPPGEMPNTSEDDYDRDIYTWNETNYQTDPATAWVKL